LAVAGAVEACWGVYDIIGGIRTIAARTEATTTAAAQQVDTGPLAFLNTMGGLPLITIGVVGVLIAALILLGAVRMKNLQSYGLAKTCSIVAMLPCNYLCVVGLVFGIWSLAVLARPEVREAFSS
jgi:hypothetical protein